MSRGLTFWNDDTIKLIKENFIAVAVPTWVCRADGLEGEFLRQAGIHKQWVTSSGYMSCISADGTMLGRAPSAKVLEAFGILPAAQRQPGSLKLPDLPAEKGLIPAPPAGGLVLRVHARFLARSSDGSLRHARAADFPLMQGKENIARSWALFLQPNTEYMWMTREEWQALVPATPKRGQTLSVDRAIAERLARFHLTPQRATTSEGGIIGSKAVKTARLDLVVEDVTDKQIRMRLQGQVHWGSDFDPASATTPNGPLRQGFETPLHGRLVFDRAKQVFTRFDIVAPGDVWGRWGDANGKSMVVERPGRNPFGFALELADPANNVTDRIPPGGNPAYISKTHGYFASK